MVVFRKGFYLNMRVWNFFIIIVVSLGILYGGFNAGVYSYVYYKKFQQKRALKKFQEEIKKQEEAERQKLMADAYGGKTPQETLQMFIEAVEKGNYELASKYFVEEKQKEWKERLPTIKNIDFLIQTLKDAEKIAGEYSEDKNSYTIYKPALTNFILYPNGIWKLTDI